MEEDGSHNSEEVTLSTPASQFNEAKLVVKMELEYETIFTVIESWELLRRLPDHELAAGSILFSK